MKSLKNSIAILILFLAVVLLSLSGLVKGGEPQDAKVQGAKPTSDVPVTSTLNTTGSVVPNPGTNYRVEGDGNGQYFNGVSSVSSILQAGSNCTPTSAICGDWILDTTSSTARTVLVDLRSPVPGSNAKQIFAFQSLPTRIITKCHEALLGSFLAIQVNHTVGCPMFVRFVYAGTTYRLAMTSGPGAATNYAETNDAQVTCTALNSSNVCTAWTILPVKQAGGTVQNVARLEQAEKNGSWVDLGDFYVTFDFNVTNP
jgi:hypothetical protein